MARGKLSVQLFTVAEQHEPRQFVIEVLGL